MEAQVISSIISVSGALVGALGGSVLANRFAEIRADKQAKVDEQKEKRSLLLTKAEELHILLSKWSKYISSINYARVAFLLGKIHVNDYHEMVNKMDFEAGIHDRIEALIYLYFPVFERDLVDMQKLLDQTIEVEIKFKHRNISSSDAVNFVDKNAKTLERKFTDMNKTIVKIIK